MQWFRNQVSRLYDLVIAASDSVKTTIARKRYPHSVPIHIVGLAEYSVHYLWLSENVEDHEHTVWTIFQKDYYHFTNGVVETHYIGEFRFKRNTDAVNYWLRFNQGSGNADS
jgi:hypothetical protein